MRLAHLQRGQRAILHVGGHHVVRTITGLQHGRVYLSGKEPPRVVAPRRVLAVGLGPGERQGA